MSKKYRTPLLRRAAVAAVFVAIALAAWWITGRAAQKSDVAPEFTGAGTCASCHQEEERAWAGSHHDRAMQLARPGAVLGDFDNARFTYGDVTSTFFRRDGRFFVRTDGPGGSLQDFEIQYTYGVEPLQQYLIEFSGGRLQPLSIAWDSRPAGEGGQRWFHLYPNQGIKYSDELHWTSRQQNWNFMCADCHSTNVRKGYDPEADRFRTTWSEINVACEACHGPGSRHVKWARTSAWRRALFWRDDGLTASLIERRGVSWAIDPQTRQPKRSVPLTTRTELEVCAQCHSRRAQIGEGYVAGSSLHDYYIPEAIVTGLYHSDGQQREEVYVYGSFLQSRMHAAGVTCSDCHDPHSQKLRAGGNALCGQCHAPASYDARSHHFHAEGGSGAQCVSCHMPEATYMVVDRRRDHQFAVPRPDLSVELGVPNACNGCHGQRSARWAADTVRSWYQGNPAGFQRFAEVFHAADQNERKPSAALRQIADDRSQPAVIRASALTRLRDEPGPIALDAAREELGDADPMVRRAALLVLEALSRPENASLAVPLLADPSRMVRIQAAWLVSAASSRLPRDEDTEIFNRAAAEFIDSQRYNADRPESRVSLGAFFAQIGRLADAAAEYEAALRLAPAFSPAYVNLADLHRAQGMEGDAERTLRQGLLASPNDPALHHAIGLSLARARRIPEAVAELERAATLAPDNPQFIYAYAVALHSSGQQRQAIRALEQARLRHPQSRALLFALATFHRDAGEREEAVRYAQLLTELFPNDGEARALFQSLQR